MLHKAEDFAFQLSADPQPLPCFVSGTAIATPTGERAVEELTVGDEVVTSHGHIARIMWVGTRMIDCLRHPAPATVWPVRVSAGAFGENVPARDLYLSPDHAVCVNDVLVPAKLLINGSSIVQMERDEVRYFHVELLHHDVILAEGLAVESYLDTGDRANFHLVGGPIQLYPVSAERLAPDTALLWETRGAAPLVMAGEALAWARRMVAPHVLR